VYVVIYIAALIQATLEGIKRSHPTDYY